MKKLLLLLLMLTPFLLAQVEVSTRLQRVLQSSKSTDFVKGIIYLKDQVDVEALDARLYKDNASLEKRAYTVITALQEKARLTQGPLTAYLEQQKAARNIFSYQSFWIANMFQIEAKPEVFRQLTGSMELAQMDLDAELQYDRPVAVAMNTKGIESVEPGVKIINADKLWRLGITGQGRIVMNIDTGVEANHPALNYKWRGTHVPASQAWFDPAGTTTPTDCDGHGTHTMGTMCGVGRTTGDTVGIAINAEWIAAKTICSSPHTSNSVAAYQWAMNPDNNPLTITDMPDVISSSWYDPDVSDECNGIYKTTLNAVEAVGIACVFSAGNDGPGTSTITKPKNINTDEVNVFCVANIDGSAYLQGSNDPIASTSSRGPSDCGGTGSLLIKPEVAAPGTSVRSSYPPATYSNLSGTSMASPHVAGAIALLRSFVPTLTGKQIKTALYNTAKDLGATGEDNNYGKGLIDIYAAYLTLGTPDTVPPTQVTDLTGAEPTSNSIKLTWTAPSDTSPNGVTGYNIRFSQTPIADTNAFNNATPVIFTGIPKPAGQTESIRIDSLLSGTTYYFALRARDIWSNWSAMSNAASKATLAPPVAAVTPDSLKKLLVPQTVVTDSVMITNIAVVPSTLGYIVEPTNNTFPPSMVDISLVPVFNNDADKTIINKDQVGKVIYGQAIEGSGGPDSSGYKWIDSDEPNGPQFVWNDIVATGTQVTNWVATGTFDAKDEGYAGPFQIGFPFKFCRLPQTQIYISTNGLIMFNAPSGNIFTNAQIPTATIPNGYIAAFWDDLTGVTSGTVHYKQDGDKFIVQFTNWQKYLGTSSSLTFQIVIYASGKILYYYKNMNATLNEATVGIENYTGTNGLQMIHNATYVKNNLAVKIASEPDWYNAQNLAGLLYTGSSAAVKITFRSEDFPAGQYGMDLKIRTNDPQHQLLTVPVRMTINNPLVPITVTAPNGGENWSAGTTKNITWTSNNVTNVNIKYTTDNGTNWLPVAAGISAAAGTYAWSVPFTPSAQCKVRISNAEADTLFDVSNGAFTISTGQVSWQAAVTLKDNGNNTQVLTMGQSPIATNGIDASLGEYSLPPSPPTGTFDARFELPVTPVDFSWKDYRPDTLQNATWLMKFQPGTQGYPFAITWDPQTLPTGNFILQDIVSGTLVNIDMKSQNSYSLTNSGITALKIVYTKQLSVPMALAAGWNMVSVPVTAANMGASSVFSGANSSVFGYNNGYVVQNTLAIGAGYWVRYANASSFNVSGTPAPGITVPLMSGWNMVGPYHWNVTVSGITTTPSGIINSSFFGFNNGYTQATTLEKGKGYWVRASQAGTMNLPASLAKEGDNELFVVPKDYARITFSDASGSIRTLYAATTHNSSLITQNSSDLPPVPPAGIFDVRFGTQKNTETIGSDGKTVLINSAIYPVTVQASGSDFRVVDLATNGSMINSFLKDGERLIISNNAVSVIVLRSLDKPVSYELMQNYPNPFNPATTIKFGLPEKANVTLTVYNQLGEKVSVLFTGIKEAGYHSFEWNGAGQSSGVYFYELKSDKFSSIKKLILMK